MTLRTPSNAIHRRGPAGGAGAPTAVTCDICARNSQTPFMRKPVLNDDRAIMIGAITFTLIIRPSSQAGLQCGNPEGRGFFLSRTRQQVS